MTAFGIEPEGALLERLSDEFRASLGERPAQPLESTLREIAADA